MRAFWPAYSHAGSVLGIALPTPSGQDSAHMALPLLGQVAADTSTSRRRPILIRQFLLRQHRAQYARHHPSPAGSLSEVACDAALIHS